VDERRKERRPREEKRRHWNAEECGTAKHWRIKEEK
jgi:hypothetical protein